MALTILPYLSPRLVIVQAPDVEITVQELVDQLRDWEDSEEGMAYEPLISAAGKENLGGGVTVGITATLLNTRLAFESRNDPLYTGSITTASSGGTVTDSTATFVTDGVEPGALVANVTSGASGTVITVDSETQLTVLYVQGGTRQDWQVSDVIQVYNTIQCNVSGGNLVAVDSVGADLDPIFPTAFTQVVRTSSSSATLQELQDIQFASFNGGVWYDATSPYSGTVFPTGTERQAVNNLADAQTIAAERGFNTYYIVGDLTVGSGFTFADAVFVGQGQNLSEITLDPAANITNCTFYEAKIMGTLDGECHIEDCLIDGLTFVSGIIERCILNSGTITLGGSQTAHFIDCASGVPGTGTPIIDCGGSGQPLAMRNYNGGVKLINKTGSDSVSIDLNSGQVRIDTATVTNGTVVCRGTGKVVNDATDAWLPSDTYGSMTLLNEVQGAAQTQILEGAITTEEALRIILAAVAGKASGASTTEMRFRDSQDTKDRIIATVDLLGNRDSVTLDGS